MLVLCHGNKYRSPLAAALLAKSKHLNVKSAGFTKPKQRAARAMRDYARTINCDLEEHRSQRISRRLIKWADYVVLMDGGNHIRYFNFLQQRSVSIAEQPQKLFLGNFAKPPQDVIRDPAFMPVRGVEFTEIAKLITQASRRLRTHLATKALDQTP